jgi:phospholipase C
MVQHTLWSSLAWACVLGLTLGWTLGEPPRAWAQSCLSQVNHIVMVMQENHSFDNYFGVLPLATGTPYHPGVVLSKLCSLAIAASHPIEFK